MRKSLYLSRILIPAVLLVWGLYTKAHPGYDMILCGEKIGSVKNKTQAEDILTIIRHETNDREIPVSLYLRFFKAPVQSDAALLLENARQASGVQKTNEAVPLEAPAEEATASAPFAPPLSGAWVSSPFGARDGRMHEGVDLAANYGVPISASADGTVSFSGEVEGYGMLLILKHADGYESYYAHCSTLCYAEGDTVKKGDVIAEVGSTGKSTGPHLHFEIRKDGIPEDPLSHLGDAFI